MSNSLGAARSPWWFIPTLYFQQGLPVVIVQQVSVLLYKKMGVPNEQIGLWTSLITWPWIAKMLWGPMVDLTASKRRWVQAMQWGVTFSLLGAALAMTSESFLPVTLGLFLLTAFLSATHDVALDGYYLLALKKEQQAFFVGIRSTFFRLAMIFGSGAIVIFAGLWERQGLPVAESWRNAIALSAGAYGLLMVIGFFSAPKLPHDRAAREEPVRRASMNGAPSAPAPFIEAFRTFFTQDKVVVVLLFILLYRFGESMLSKMTGLFLLDSRAAGGLGLDTVQVGAILGNVGVIALVGGGLLGGFAISKFGLRACIWPMILAMNLPNLLYIWAAITLPEPTAVYGIIAVDQFGYGFGFAAYMVYLMYLCQGSKYSTSHYAIATGLMALGAMLAGIVSGYLQKYLGYVGFFVAVCFFTVPGMLLLQFIPMEREKMVSDTSSNLLAE